MANNQDNISIAKRKEARGAVLGLLEEGYPTGVSYQVMERILHSTGKCQSHELPGVIKYLEDKKYIVVALPEEPSLKPLQSAIVELSAHGVDLLEGSIPDDPGISI